MLEWIKGRLNEPSTLRGLTIVLGLIGIALQPDQLEAILILAGSIIGAIEVFRKEKPPEPPA